MNPSRSVVFENVSKFYGEVLGVNRVNLAIEPGITSLVGPNGSGKTTLMNLLTGLIKPSAGRIAVFGRTPDDPESFFRTVGYATQFDSFPHLMTGRDLLCFTLDLHGFSRAEARRLANEALELAGLHEAADRKVAGYSRGMRQRLRLAHALAHRPQLLVLDEPLNGLDPVARAEFMVLFRAWAAEGKHVLLSSHILHEVDELSDRVVLLQHGYVVAEGRIEDVREEVDDQPVQILIRCTNPAWLAARALLEGAAVEARLHEDGGGLLVRARESSRFYWLLNRMAASGEVGVDSVTPADADVLSVYQYLVTPEGGTA